MDMEQDDMTDSGGPASEDWANAAAALAAGVVKEAATLAQAAAGLSQALSAGITSDIRRHGAIQGAAASAALRAALLLDVADAMIHPGTALERAARVVAAAKRVGMPAAPLAAPLRAAALALPTDDAAARIAASAIAEQVAVVLEGG